MSRREAMGMMVDLWAWAVDLTPEGQSPELIGVFQDPDPAGMIAAALEWRGDVPHLFESMRRSGFVELVDNGFRVKGGEMYAEALGVPSKRSEAGKKGMAKRWGAIREAAGLDNKPVTNDNKPITNAYQADNKALTNDNQTQTQTQTQTQKEEKNVRTSAQDVLGGIPEKPEKPDDAWDGMDFWTWAQAKRHEAGLQPERWPNERTVSTWWSATQMRGVAVKALRLAFIDFGNEPFWTDKKRKPPVPFGGFVSQWERFVAPEVGSATG